MAASNANRWCEFSSKLPKLKCALGNKDDKLSLSRIIYSTQQACNDRRLKFFGQWYNVNESEKSDMQYIVTFITQVEL